jgi:hypothetical protein
LKADCTSRAAEWPDGDFYCKSIDFDSMSGDGTILRVPTTFDAGDTTHAYQACFFISRGHRTADGTPLGYETVGILDADGANASACPVEN